MMSLERTCALEFLRQGCHAPVVRFGDKGSITVREPPPRVFGCWPTVHPLVLKTF